MTNALKSLQKDGYVVINPRSGSYVRELTKEELEYIFDFREVLEAQVIRKAITKLDKKKLKEFGEKFRLILSVSLWRGRSRYWMSWRSFLRSRLNSTSI